MSYLLKATMIGRLVRSKIRARPKDGAIETAATEKKDHHVQDQTSPRSAAGRSVAGTPRPTNLTSEEKISSPIAAGTRRRSVVGTISVPELTGPWSTAEQAVVPSVTSDASDDEVEEKEPEGRPYMALEPYAAECYSVEEQRFLGKKTMPLEALLCWKNKEITVPLTKACNESRGLAHECVISFGEIMEYMGDKKVKEAPVNILKGLQLKMLEGSEEFRDEIFCQVRMDSVHLMHRSLSTLLLLD